MTRNYSQEEIQGNFNKLIELLEADDEFEDNPDAPQTAWGPAQKVYQIGPGITFYGTASHGGFYLSSEMNEKLPQEVKAKTFMQNGLLGWYEEDEDAGIVESFFHVDRYAAVPNLIPRRIKKMTTSKTQTRKKAMQEQPPEDKFTLFLAELENKIAELTHEWKKASESAASLRGDEDYEDEYNHACDVSDEYGIKLSRFEGFKKYTTAFLNRLSDTSNTQETQL